MTHSQTMPAAPYALNADILRAYDIRGIIGETLGEDDAYHIGRAFGSIVREQTKEASPAVCVGYDGRLSSPMLEGALVRGLSDSGATVLRTGLGPTPMLYYSVCEMNADAGIMVTGSHNPPHHNGFKFMLGKGSFYGEAIQTLGAHVARGDYAQGKGTVRDEQLQGRYIERLLSAYTSKKEMKIAWDAGNGAAGEAVAALCARLPGTHIPMYTEIDGNFPNHHPDPTVPENLTALIDRVRQEGCDAGFAFDGDGDRLGVVDGEGAILWGDQLMQIYAADLLPRLPGATVIADIKASQTLFDRVAELGGTPLMWKTGHSHIKSKMKEIGAPIAGEMSGHLFFAEGYYGFDDGLYAGVRLLNILAESGKSLAQWRREMVPVLATPEIRFDCEESRKFEVIDEVAARLQAAGADYASIDGVRVSTSHGWWLLRASNTQAALSARCEAATEAGLAALKDDLRAQLAASGVALPEE